MCLLSGALGILITSLLTRSADQNDYLFCSNLKAMNSANIPYFNVLDNIALLPTTNRVGGSILYHLNWAFVTGVISLSGPPGAATAS
jgi:hypothetical protein